MTDTLPILQMQKQRVREGVQLFRVPSRVCTGLRTVCFCFSSIGSGTGLGDDLLWDHTAAEELGPCCKMLGASLAHPEKGRSVSKRRAPFFNNKRSLSIDQSDGHR